MTDTITITGLVATAPKHLVTGEGLSITSFRLASSQRRFDRSKQRWVDGETNWYTITTFRQLATNVIGSVDKGDRVIVTGRLRIRDWESGERSGTNIDIEAEAMGHDLSWGTSRFVRSISSLAAETSSPAAAWADGKAAEVASAATAIVSEERTPETGTVGDQVNATTGAVPDQDDVVVPF